MCLTLYEHLQKAAHFTALPSKKEEKWRFSNLFSYLDKKYRKPKSTSEVPSFTPKQRYWLHIHDGQLLKQSIPASVHIRHHSHLSEISDNPFSCLASSTAPSPTELSCYEDIALELCFTYSDESFITSSLDITLKENVNVSIYLSYTGGEKSFISNTNHIKLSAYARLELTQAQDLRSGAVFVTQNSLHQQENSFYKGFYLLHSGEYLHNFVQADLHHQSEAEITSLLLSDHKQQEIFSCDIRHLADKSKSKVLSKQVIKDESICVFDANTTIIADTKATRAQQASHALLLSKSAHIHAKPHLEIYSDDLSASHGTTVGELGKEALNYLISRGIKEEKAKEILISAFVHETLQSIEKSDMQEPIKAVLGESYDFV